MDKYHFEPLTHNGIIDPIEEANRRYEEKIKNRTAKPVYDSRKEELLKQMDVEYDLALKAAGLDFFKRVCSIDQELAHNILSIFSQAVENNDFDEVEMSFRKIVAKKIDEEKGTYKFR